MNIIQTLESFDKNTTERQIKELADLLYKNKIIGAKKCKLLFVKLVAKELQDNGNTNMWHIYELLVNPAYRKIIDELIEEISGKSRGEIILDTHDPIFALLCGNLRIGEEIIQANKKLKRNGLILRIELWALNAMIFFSKFVAAVMVAYIIYEYWIK